VTGDDLKRFRDACLTVLGEPDPSLDLPPDERWLAGVRDKLPRHSGPLREGLARSLVLLAKLGDAAEVASEPSPAAWAERIVRDLFGREPDAACWSSLSGILREFAAAAPDLFLRLLEASLARPDRPVMTLVAEEGGSFSPGSRHPGLLWALEALAWDPRRLGRVTLALGRLVALDPGGRLGNPPSGSLRAIFLPWFPQTRPTSRRGSPRSTGCSRASRRWASACSSACCLGGWTTRSTRPARSGTTGRWRGGRPRRTRRPLVPKACSRGCCRGSPIIRATGRGWWRGWASTRRTASRPCWSAWRRSFRLSRL